MRIIHGGTAVMYKVPSFFPHDWWSAIKGQAAMWGAPLKEDYHLTLQFVGRDIDVYRLRDVFFSIVEVQAATLKFTGSLTRWATKKGRYMVARVEATNELLEQRAALRSLGIVNDFTWAPHVTLVEDKQTSLDDVDFLLSEVTPFEFSPSQLVLKYGNRTMELDLR